MGISYDPKTNTPKCFCGSFRVKQLWRRRGKLSCNSCDGSVVNVGFLWCASLDLLSENDPKLISRTRKH